MYDAARFVQYDGSCPLSSARTEKMDEWMSGSKNWQKRQPNAPIASVYRSTASWYRPPLNAKFPCSFTFSASCVPESSLAVGESGGAWAGDGAAAGGGGGGLQRRHPGLISPRQLPPHQARKTYVLEVDASVLAGLGRAGAALPFPVFFFPAFLPIFSRCDAVLVVYQGPSVDLIRSLVRIVWYGRENRRIGRTSGMAVHSKTPRLPRGRQANEEGSRR